MAQVTSKIFLWHVKFNLGHNMRSLVVLVAGKDLTEGEKNDWNWAKIWLFLMKNGCLWEKGHNFKAYESSESAKIVI